MNLEKKKQDILDALTTQKAFFNPTKSPKKITFIQHTFNEPEGKIEYFFEIKNRVCLLKEGRVKKPLIDIVTDSETWEKIGGGYISGKKAIQDGKFQIIGGLFNFLFKYKKMFSGNSNWDIPKGSYSGSNNSDIKKIKRVLVMSCSPRAEKGATHLLVEHFVKGLKNAGAKVDVLFPAKMKINPCKGCFNCWLKEGVECVYKDDMQIFWDYYMKSDLIVWATPIYFYHCTTAMKTVLDRIIARSNPYVILNNGKETHARKNKHLPNYLLLATSGFMDKAVFEPLKLTFKEHAFRIGIKILSEIIRPGVVPMIAPNYKNIKKDQILKSLENAGEEVVKYNFISKKTKKNIEQQFMKLPEFLSGSHATMDKVLKEKNLSIIEREL